MDHLKEGSEGDGGPYQIRHPQLGKAIAVVKEYCAIGPESKMAGSPSLSRRPTANQAPLARNSRLLYCLCAYQSSDRKTPVAHDSGNEKAHPPVLVTPDVDVGSYIAI
jgi:hypothetical protein